MKLRISQPLDFAVGGLALALTVVIGVVILAGTWEGVQVNIITVEENGEIGPLSSIILKIFRAGRPALAQSFFSIQPSAQGRLDWVDARTLRFTPWNHCGRSDLSNTNESRISWK